MKTVGLARQFLSSVADLLAEKDAAYGESIASPLHVFSQLPPIEGVKLRIDDKLKRIFCGVVMLLCCLECAAYAKPSEARQALRILCPAHLDLAPHFDRAAGRYGLPVEMLVAVARQESRCDPMARGKLGERGVGQLKPGTIAALGVPVDHLNRPGTNIRLMARHLARCLLLCGDWAAALGVYSGRRTCPAGRASPYARRVLELFEQAKGAKS
jgi:hypothetical protein